MKQTTLAILALATVTAAHASVITRWDFNSEVPDANTATGTINPSVGFGTASLVGGVTGTFSSGAANGGSSDPNIGDNSGWQTTGYPAQGTGSGTAGVQFLVSTAGFTNIQVTFDTRHSNTSSRFVSLDYTLNGATWTSFQTYEATLGGDQWYNLRSADLSSVAGVANNSSFGVRMVSVFAPTGGYSASTSTATYAGTGTLRYDMVTVSGTAVPEPASMAILGLGISGIWARRRRK